MKGCSGSRGYKDDDQEPADASNWAPSDSKETAFMERMRNTRKADITLYEMACLLDLAARAQGLAMLLGLDEPDNENGWEDLVKHMRKIREWDNYEVKLGEAYRTTIDQLPEVNP